MTEPIYMCVSTDSTDGFLHRGHRDGYLNDESWKHGNALGTTLCGKPVEDYITPLMPVADCRVCMEKMGQAVLPL